MGEKILRNIRPFDLAINFQLFFMIVGIVIEYNLGFNQISNTLLIIWIPTLMSLVINFKYPSLTYRVTSCKDKIIISNFKRSLDPRDIHQNFSDLFCGESLLAICLPFVLPGNALVEEGFGAKRATG